MAATTTTGQMNDPTQLKPFLEDLLDELNLSREREHDPVECVWQYKKDCNQEIAGLIASCLAYGSVDQIKKAVTQVLSVLGTSPHRKLRKRSINYFSEELDNFYYRMTQTEDLIDLLCAIQTLLKKNGSLEQAYQDTAPSTHHEKASAFVQRLRKHRFRQNLHRGFRYLLPDPADGSSCKRLNLFFRWMGRGPDEIDPGCWDSLSPSRLIIPLDTHTSRITRYIGLTRRKTTDLKMAREVTANLKQLDPQDPVKYDFAICHLGISEGCIHEYSPDHCPNCPIYDVCRLAAQDE